MNGNKEKLKGRTISLGVAEIDGTKNVKDLLQKVDEYLYYANCLVVLYQPQAAALGGLMHSIHFQFVKYWH